VPGRHVILRSGFDEKEILEEGNREGAVFQRLHIPSKEERGGGKKKGQLQQPPERLDIVSLGGGGWQVSR